MTAVFNERIATVANAVRSNLAAADWGIELLEQMLKADGASDNGDLGAAWHLVRSASAKFTAAMETAGKEMSGKLDAALPQHESEGSV